ncbi:37914_t:CDS:2, partial [Gigaspora margarita]
EIEELRINLNIPISNFEVVHEEPLICSELIFSVKKKNANELLTSVQEIKNGKIIIYCAKKKNCKEFFDILEEHKDIDITIVCNNSQTIIPLLYR